MKTDRKIKDKEKLILIVLSLIALIIVIGIGVHIHSNAVLKDRATDTVNEVVEDLQAGKTAKANKILGKKISNTLDTGSMDADAYVKSIVSSLGYTSGDANTDARDSYKDLLKAGGADDSVIKNVEKLHTAFKNHVITSYEITGKDLKNNEVTVTVNVKGIILLPKVSFAEDVQNANQKLADYVNKNMDNLVQTYNQDDAGENSDADSNMNAALKKQEMKVLLPAMVKRVNKAKETEETWTFTVDVSSDHTSIKNVSINNH